MNEDVEKDTVKEEKKAKKEKKKLEKQARGGNDLKIIIIISSVVVLLALAIFGYFVYNKDLKPVVKYDGGSVSASDYEIYYRTFAPILSMYGADESTLPKIIAEKAASDKITVAEATKAGIKISDEDKKYVDGIFSDNEQIEKFKQSGIDPTKMKQFYYNDYIMDDYIESLKAALTDEEVKSYITSTYGEDASLEEYVTNHILIFKVDSQTGAEYAEDKKAEAKAKAEGLLARALAGEDFETLAKENSEDGTASEGGKYIVYKDEMTNELYQNAAISLKAGEIYPSLVETDYGYHIIKLSEYNEQGRLKSDRERTNIVNNKLSDLVDSKNVQCKNDAMQAVVEKVTGKTETSNDETNTDNTNEDNSGSDENTGDTSNEENTQNETDGDASTETEKQE